MRFLLPFLALLAAAPAFSASPADTAFEALAKEDQDWSQADRGLIDGEDDDRIAPRLPDVTPPAQAKRLATLEGYARRLAAIDPNALGEGRRTDAAIYRYQLDTRIARLRFRNWEMPFNSDSSFWGNLGYTAGRDFRTEADYRNWIAQLRQLPAWFADQTVNMRAGMARGFTPPRMTLAGREASLDAIADAADPTATSLYKPFAKMPAGMAPATAAGLRTEAAEAIRAAIPAYRALRGFVKADYIPKARTTLSAAALPDGEAFYRAQIAEYATVAMTPAEIHRIGLTEMAAIRARMAGVMAETGFQGDFPAFLGFLRTDPRFYAKTPEDLLKQAAWIAKQMDGKAATYFGHLPRRRFAIVPVPADIAPFYTAGRGGDGIYLLNTYDLPSRPLYQLAALTLHESAPGHAFQIPLARENRDRLPFRRNLYISAYGEGWALYCETLGEEMGLYETPYDRFGMLSYQAWRAARLVIDTGLHSMGWSREQAQAYLRDNTALSQHEIETEVDRYISWPGQALSYYLGEMAIRQGRAKAEKALGPKFNIRAFHDMILALGSVPLPVLDQAVDGFIAKGGIGPYPDEE
ncbi:DUF885 family protein [Sphingomonas sp.]|uniref:DUF885 domain-containing protein n=1 Tax=Sphingomonas sp. TaxID=28214 RepID=UPI00345B84C4